jgi:hypothetical protein
MTMLAARSGSPAGDGGRQPTIACATFSASAGFDQVVRSAENDTSEGQHFEELKRSLTRPDIFSVF